MVPRRSLAALASLTVLVGAVALSGCGEEEELEEPHREGLSVEFGDLDYNVFITRQLNIKNPEDHDYYQGPDAPPGSNLYSVFIEVCNSGDKPATAAKRFKIIDTQHNEFEPIEISERNVFAYRSRTIAPDDCIPAPSSAASSAPTAGAMLLFSLPLEATENRPLELEILGDYDFEKGEYEKALVELDI